MDQLSEEELAESFVWSEQSYTLARLLTEHSLPKIIRVIQGYDGGADSRNLGHGEVLTLHEVRVTKVFSGEDSQGHVITIPVDCPNMVHVLPRADVFQNNNCRVEELARVFPKVKYIQVVRGHDDTGESKDESMKDEELFEILNVDKKNKKAKLKNIASGLTSTFSSKCNAVLTPLLDWRTFRLTDLKSIFEFPVRVQFLSMKGESNVHTKTKESLRLVTSTSEVTIIEEIEDVFVVATTIGKSDEFKFCYEIPKDLQVKVTVAKGLREKDADSYQDVVTKLDKRFDVANLPNSQQLNSFKRRDSITEYNYTSIQTLFQSIPGEQTAKSAKSTAILERIEDLPEISSPVLPPRHFRLKSTKSLSHLQKEPTEQEPLRRAASEKPKVIPRQGSRPSKERNAKALSCSGSLQTNSPKTRPEVPIRSKYIQEATTGSNFVADPEIHIRDLTSGPVSPLGQAAVLESSKKHVPISRQQSPRPAVKLPKASNHTLTNVLERTTKDLPISEKECPNTASIPIPTHVPPVDSEIPAADIPEEPPTFPSVPHPDPEDPQSPLTLTSQPPKSPRLTCAEVTRPPSEEHISTDDVSRPEECPALPPRVPLRAPISHTTQHDFSNGSNNTYYETPADTFAAQANPHHTSQTGFDVPVYEEVDLSAYGKEINNYLSLQRCDSDVKSSDNTGYHGTMGNWNISDLLVTEEPGMESQYANVSRIPLDLSCLSIQGVAQLLKNLHMDRYVQTFENELIDGNLLKKLKESDLESLQVSSFHATKLMEFIKGWRPRK